MCRRRSPLPPRTGRGLERPPDRARRPGGAARGERGRRAARESQRQPAACPTPGRERGTAFDHQMPNVRMPYEYQSVCGTTRPIVRMSSRVASAYTAKLLPRHRNRREPRGRLARQHTDGEDRKQLEDRSRQHESVRDHNARRERRSSMTASTRRAKSAISTLLRSIPSITAGEQSAAPYTAASPGGARSGTTRSLHRRKSKAAQTARTVVLPGPGTERDGHPDLRIVRRAHMRIARVPPNLDATTGDSHPEVTDTHVQEVRLDQPGRRDVPNAECPPSALRSRKYAATTAATRSRAAWSLLRDCSVSRVMRHPIP